jgi:hypothetical protein
VPEEEGEEKEEEAEEEVELTVQSLRILRFLQHVKS